MGISPISLTFGTARSLAALRQSAPGARESQGGLDRGGVHRRQADPKAALSPGDLPKRRA